MQNKGQGDPSEPEAYHSLTINEGDWKVFFWSVDAEVKKSI